MELFAAKVLYQDYIQSMPIFGAMLDHKNSFCHIVNQESHYYTTYKLVPNRLYIQHHFLYLTIRMHVFH